MGPAPRVKLLTMIDVHVLGPGRAPEEIDAAIKAIDPAAELVHLGGLKWWLGVRAPNPAAVDQLADAHNAAARRPVLEDPAERAMMEVELVKEFQMYQVMAAGFRPIALYTIDGHKREDGWAWWEVVDDFRQRDHHWRTSTESAFAGAVKSSISADRLNAERIKEFGRMATEVAAEAFNFVFKKARSFTRSIGARARRRPTITH